MYFNGIILKIRIQFDLIITYCWAAHGLELLLLMKKTVIKEIHTLSSRQNFAVSHLFYLSIWHTFSIRRPMFNEEKYIKIKSESVCNFTEPDL